MDVDGAFSQGCLHQTGARSLARSLIKTLAKPTPLHIQHKTHQQGLEVEGRPVRVAFATDSFAALVGPTTTSTANPTLCSGASIAAAADPATATAVPSVVAKPRPEWPPSFEEGA